MRVLVVVFGFAACFMLTACGRIYGPVEQVKALMEEKAEVISQIDKKIEESPNEAGVDAARKVFEARKDSLRTKRKAIRDSPQGMNSDWQSMLWESDARDLKSFQSISTRLAVACWQVECAPAKEKFSQLETDFKDTVK